MTRNSAIFRVALLTTAAAAAALACSLASADPGFDHRGPERGAPPAAHQHMDARFSHNHAYYDRGYFVGNLPRDRLVFNRGPNRYFYAGGVWYAPRGAGFVVVGAPFGLFVPVLPPFYSTVWFGGVPYYYANDTYYNWDASQNGYVVAQPPADPTAGTTQPPQSDDLFIYPQNGQTQDQQSSDKYECHKWANQQTGYDPTQSGGGVSADQADARRADYQRAMRACLEGRGYSVR
jgi:hypothetical protein